MDETIYVCSPLTCVVYAVAPDGTAVNVFAGIYNYYGRYGCGGSGAITEGVPATSIHLGNPVAVAASNTTVYILDASRNVVFAVDIQSGIIFTFAGSGNATYEGDGSSLDPLSLNVLPIDIAVDISTNDLLVADASNNYIWRVSQGGDSAAVVAGAKFRTI